MTEKNEQHPFFWVVCGDKAGLDGGEDDGAKRILEWLTWRLRSTMVVSQESRREREWQPGPCVPEQNL
jgi:hypothetical protein